MRFWRKFKYKFLRWKLINTSKYLIIPKDKYYFILSDKEQQKAKEIYKNKGTIEYTFYPCGGIGWGCKVKVWKTNEYIDITDMSDW